MWILVVLTIDGGYSSTQSNLAMCQQNLGNIGTSEVREAYCLSPTGDRIYFIKDSKQLIETNATQT